MKSPRRLSTTLAFMSSLVACRPNGGDDDSATDAITGDAASTLSSSDGSTADPQVTTGECAGAPATSTAGEEAVSDLSCPDHVKTDACCCFEGDGERINNVCEQYFPCPEIVVSHCQSPDCTSDYELVTDCPDAIDCALSTLAASQTGTIRWKIYNEAGAEEMQIHLLGDGTAFRYRRYRKDLGCDVDPFTRNALQPTSYFMACTAKPALMERFACVRSAFVGDPIQTDDPIETCIDTLSCGAL